MSLSASNHKFRTILINANRSHDQYAQFGHPVIADAEDGFLGPLAGILAGLRAARTELLLCVPCDSPEIGPNLAAKLALSLRADRNPNRRGKLRRTPAAGLCGAAH